MRCSAHHTNICEQFWKYPNTRRRDNDGDHVEYESYDRQSKECTDEAKHPHTDVPHAETHDGRPQWEHDSGEHDGHHEQTASVRRPLGPLVEPCKVAVLRERLLGGDSDVARRG